MYRSFKKKSINILNGLKSDALEVFKILHGLVVPKLKNSFTAHARAISLWWSLWDKKKLLIIKIFNSYLKIVHLYNYQF